MTTIIEILDGLGIGAGMDDSITLDQSFSSNTNRLKRLGGGTLST